MNPLHLAMAVAGGYLLGAIPTAYLLVRARFGSDLRREGTGNIGAMNAYEVTGRRWIGLATALLDIAKGALAVLLAYHFAGGAEAASAALVAATFGHCYNIFIKGGGRGLAVAAGGYLALNALPVFLFLVCYFTLRGILTKNVHVLTIGGVLGGGMILLSVPSMQVFLDDFSVVRGLSVKSFEYLYAAVGIIIFVRNLGPVREFFYRNRGSI